MSRSRETAESIRQQFETLPRDVLLKKFMGTKARLVGAETTNQWYRNQRQERFEKSARERRREARILKLYQAIKRRHREGKLADRLGEFVELDRQRIALQKKVETLRNAPSKVEPEYTNTTDTEKLFLETIAFDPETVSNEISDLIKSTGLTEE